MAAREGLDWSRGPAFLNKDGTAIAITIGILFLAHAMNIHLSTVTVQFTGLSGDAAHTKGYGWCHRG